MTDGHSQVDYPELNHSALLVGPSYKGAHKHAKRLDTAETKEHGKSHKLETHGRLAVVPPIVHLLRHESQGISSSALRFTNMEVGNKSQLPSA